MSPGPGPGAGRDDGRDGRVARLRRPFYNRREDRLRAGWRVFVHGVLAVLGLAVAVPGAAALAAAVPAGAAGGLPVSLRVGLLQGPAVGAVLLGSVWVGARYLDRRPRPLAGVGLAPTRAWLVDCAFGLALGAALMTLVFLVELAAGYAAVTGLFVVEGAGGAGSAAGAGSVAGAGAGAAGTDGPGAGAGAGASASAGDFLARALVASVTFACVGLYEEAVSRGYHLTNAAEGLARAGPRAAVLGAAALSALSFGAAHALNPGASALSVAGVVAAGLLVSAGYVLTGRLGLPVGVHVAWNAVQGVVFGFPVSGLDVGAAVVGVRQSGPAVVTGGPFGPEGGLLGVGAAALGVGAVVGYVRVREGRVALRTDLAVYDGRE